jgi:V/A-type H+-transporting ATPase subunit E
MGLEKLVEDILRKGDGRAKEIISQGEAERDARVKLADKDISEKRVLAEKRLESQISQMEQHELSSAELESRKMLLAAQREVLEDLRERILVELSDYPDDKRRALYAKLFAKAKEILGDCYVYSNKADEPTLKPPSGITKAGVMDCSGGLVFESKDRSVRLDYRFETLLEEVWSKRMSEIFSQLFG